MHTHKAYAAHMMFCILHARKVYAGRNFDQKLRKGTIIDQCDEIDEIE